MSEIKECQVHLQQLLNVLMVLGAALSLALLSAIAIEFSRSAIYQLKKLSLPEGSMLPPVTAIFVGVLSAVLLYQGPLKPKAKENINNVAFYDGKQVVPCDKDKSSKKKTDSVAQRELCFLNSFSKG